MRPAAAPKGNSGSAAPGLPITHFLARLVATWCAGFIIIGLFPQIEQGAIRLTIAILLPVLRAGVTDVKLVGNQLCLLGVSFEIVSDCTPLVGGVLLVGAIVAFPTRLAFKAAGILAGLLCVVAFDVTRIVALFIVLANWPKALDLVHVYLWQTLTIALVVGLFLLWSDFVTRRATA